jgi:hypothetical protein
MYSSNGGGNRGEGRKGRERDRSGRDGITLLLLSLSLLCSRWGGRRGGRRTHQVNAFSQQLIGAVLLYVGRLRCCCGCDVYSQQMGWKEWIRSMSLCQQLRGRERDYPSSNGCKVFPN